MDLSPLNGTICWTVGRSVGGIGVSGRYESLSRFPLVSIHVGATAFVGVKRKEFDHFPLTPSNCAVSVSSERPLLHPTMRQQCVGSFLRDKLQHLC